MCHSMMPPRSQAGAPPAMVRTRVLSCLISSASGAAVGAPVDDDAVRGGEQVSVGELRTPAEGTADVKLASTGIGRPTTRPSHRAMTDR